MAVYITTPSPALPPPSTSVGVLGWMRKNLFSSFANSILTLIGVYLLFLIIPPTINWALFQ
ncbi:MAG: amino acid ABC transporter permease, partial [Proteobacteria bacterium]|nr:amino acid ABC transporter permease [Pseudomonadota bacterium]